MTNLGASSQCQTLSAALEVYLANPSEHNYIKKGHLACQQLEDKATFKEITECVKKLLNSAEVDHNNKIRLALQFKGLIAQREISLDNKSWLNCLIHSVCSAILGINGKVKIVETDCINLLGEIGDNPLADISQRTKKMGSEQEKADFTFYALRLKTKKVTTKQYSLLLNKLEALDEKERDNFSYLLTTFLPTLPDVAWGLREGEKQENFERLFNTIESFLSLCDPKSVKTYHPLIIKIWSLNSDLNFPSLELINDASKKYSADAKEIFFQQCIDIVKHLPTLKSDDEFIVDLTKALPEQRQLMISFFEHFKRADLKDSEKEAAKFLLAIPLNCVPSIQSTFQNMPNFINPNRLFIETLEVFSLINEESREDIINRTLHLITPPRGLQVAERLLQIKEVCECLKNVREEEREELLNQGTQLIELISEENVLGSVLKSLAMIPHDSRASCINSILEIKSEQACTCKKMQEILSLLSGMPPERRKVYSRHIIRSKGNLENFITTR